MLHWALVLGAVAATSQPATGTIAGTLEGAGNEPAYVFVDDVVVPAPPGTERQLVVRGKKYAASPYAVVVGTTGRWINDDPVYHNAFSVTPHHDFDLGTYRPHEERTHRFDVPGVVAVYCNMHPNEVGHVLVVSSPLYVKVGPAGEFVIKGVPAGKHLLKAWSPFSKMVETSAEVAAGATTKGVRLRITLGKRRPPTIRLGQPVR